VEIDKLRALAKEKGIKSYHNKKPEKLMKELGLSTEFEVTIDLGQDYLKRVGFDRESLIKKATAMKADKAVYKHQYRVFELYKNNKHFDDLSINSF